MRVMKCLSADLIGLLLVTSLGSKHNTYPDHSEEHFSNARRVSIREASFGTTDPFSLEGTGEYEKEYLQAKEEDKNVKAIILCTPHNLLGLWTVLGSCVL